jgi:hypothetical protein
LLFGDCQIVDFGVQKSHPGIMRLKIAVRHQNFNRETNWARLACLEQPWAGLAIIAALI